MRRRTDRQDSEIPELSDAAPEVDAPSEGIDITRKAPNTARIVEPAHNIRRTFGLGTGSALAVTPSMIDDNELASQTVVDESEVFDDPFYEALVAVGLDDEPALDEDAAEKPDGVTDATQPNEGADAERSNEPEPIASEQATVESAGTAAATTGTAAGADAAEAAETQEPKRKPEPQFGLEYGSALAMVPSMIDDNLLCSELVVDEAEVFDDPFFEALVAVEEEDKAPAEEAEADSETEQVADEAPGKEQSGEPAAQPKQQPKREPQFGLEHGSALALVPSMIDDNLLCSDLIADENEVFDDPFFEALVAVEDKEDNKPEAEKEEGEDKAVAESESDEADGMLYTTASALVEEDDDDEPLRGKHARVAEEPASEAEPAPETESEAEPEPETEAEPELEPNREPKPATAEATPVVVPASEPIEASGADSKAEDNLEAEEASGDVEADHKDNSSSPVEEEAATPVENEHAAAQEQPQPTTAETPAEKLPDDESVADAVDEMVLNSDYEDEHTSSSASAENEAESTPPKQGLWARFKNLFRRRKR